MSLLADCSIVCQDVSHSKGLFAESRVAMWRRYLCILTLSFVLLPVSMAQAQQAPAGGGAAPASGGAAPQGATVQTVNAQSYLFEWCLVLVMTGATLFAVCRNSRRNV